MRARAMKFRIFEGGELRGEQTLFDEVVKIGSASACHLRVAGAGVGRMHAVVEFDRDGEAHVVDLGSASGTFVNGKRITRALLKDGDRLTVGCLEIEVVLEGATRPASEPVAAAVSDPGAATAAAPALTAPPATPQVSSARAFDPALIADLTAVEDPSRQVVEVVVLWNGSVLKVDHLEAGSRRAREFCVGEDPTCDFPIPAEELMGSTRVPLVRLEPGAAAEVTLPAGASGDLTQRDSRRTDLSQLVSSGTAVPSGRAPGGHCMTVSAGARFKIGIGCWTFLINGVPAARKFAPPAKLDFSKQIFTGFSLGLHFLFFFLIAFVPPSPEGLALDQLDESNRFLPYIINAAQVQREIMPEMLTKKETPTNDPEGKRHKDTEGAMGDRTARKTDNHYGIKGPPDTKNPVMARDTIKDLTRNAGVLAYLSDATAPTSPWGALQAQGRDPENALGALVGNQYGSNYGYGGLGIYGTGRGGGGEGLGTLGVGDLNTIGRGCRGVNCGPDGTTYGRPGNDLGPRRPVPIVRGRGGEAIVKGSLSKEAIRRVVHRHVNEVKFCYEKGLMSRPDLEGRVSVKFIINGMGGVQNSAIAGSSLGHAGVEQCISQAVRRWTFPQPTGGGIVIVTYPFQLTRPGD